MYTVSTASPTTSSAVPQSAQPVLSGVDIRRKETGARCRALRRHQAVARSTCYDRCIYQCQHGTPAQQLLHVNSTLSLALFRPTLFAKATKVSVLCDM